MPPAPPAEDVVARADYKLRYPVVPRRGSYFTPDRRIAENFARNANNGYPGQLLYVDVPKSSLKGEGVHWQYVLPKDIAARAQEANWVKVSRAIGDRQVTTMGASEHPLPGTGPYEPPLVADNTGTGPRPLANAWATSVPVDIVALLRHLYPGEGGPGNPRIGRLIKNSAAIGDRPVTTMTNPLPGYRSPLQMNNTPLADQLRTLITQHLAAQPKPLVNLPLAGAATQMGRG
jgi:hypothetical protein